MTYPRYTVTVIIDGHNKVVDTDNIETAINAYRTYYNDENCTCADITDNKYAETFEYFTR